MRPNSLFNVRKKDRKNITAAKRKNTRSKRSTLSDLTVVFMRFQAHIRERSMTLPYIRIRKTETGFSEFRKKATAVIRGYKSMTAAL
jgi:hypothetical protein